MIYSPAGYLVLKLIKFTCKNENIMKRLQLMLITIFFLAAAQAQQFTLVNNSKSKYRIIIPEKGSVMEIQAAMVFQDYIQRISGAVLPILSDITGPEDNEILIGNVNREESKIVPVD